MAKYKLLSYRWWVIQFSI